MCLASKCSSGGCRPWAETQQQCFNYRQDVNLSLYTPNILPAAAARCINVQFHDIQSCSWLCRLYFCQFYKCDAVLTVWDALTFVFLSSDSSSTMASVIIREKAAVHLEAEGERHPDLTWSSCLRDSQCLSVSPNSFCRFLQRRWVDVARQRRRSVCSGWPPTDEQCHHHSRKWPVLRLQPGSVRGHLQLRHVRKPKDLTLLGLLRCSQYVDALHQVGVPRHQQAERRGQGLRARLPRRSVSTEGGRPTGDHVLLDPGCPDRQRQDFLWCVRSLSSAGGSMCVFVYKCQWKWVNRRGLESTRKQRKIRLFDQFWMCVYNFSILLLFDHSEDMFDYRLVSSML